MASVATHRPVGMRNYAVSRYRRIRDSQPGLRDRFPGLARLLEGLNACSDAQYEASIAFLDAEGSTGQVLYPTDLILLSCVARSFDLIDAFVDSVARWNMAVASSLVRLQVDNVLRVYLVTTSPDAMGLMHHIVGGQSLNRYLLPEQQRRLLPEKYQRNARATDANLRYLAALEHSWVDEVYETASKWIHHSEAHVLTTWRTHLSADGAAVSARIPVDIEQFDGEFVMGVIGSMLLASDTLLAHLRDWGVRKPQIIQPEPDLESELGRLREDPHSFGGEGATS